MADEKEYPPDPPEEETPLDAAAGAEHPDDKRDVGVGTDEE